MPPENVLLHRRNRLAKLADVDLRFAFRSLRKNPGFAFAAVAVLTLGIGAITAIFSVINTVLLKPLTYPDPQRIVYFFVNTPDGPSYGASATKFNVWRQQTQAFQDVSAYEYRGPGLNLTGGAYPEQIHGIHASADYFRLFGAPIMLGRTFTADEDAPNGDHVAVLSYGLWQRRFGGDPQMPGKRIFLSGVPYVVVGVLGPGFNTELDIPPDLWLPFQIDPNSSDHAQYFTVAGRLKPGMTLASANQQLQRGAAEFRSRFPNIAGPRDTFMAQEFDVVPSEFRSSLSVLAGAVSFVLLIACANVANLLLVRATGRKLEIAIRAAFGASRWRLIRQLLTESIVLSVIGGALGLGLGLVGVRVLLTMYPGNIPRIGEHGSAIAMDWRLALFTGSISLLTGVLFGLAPALDMSRSDLSTALKEGGGRFGTGLRQNKIRSLLVISEMALALVLLIGATLLIRTFLALRSVNPGFDSHNVLTLRMSLAGSRFQKTAQVNQLVRDAVESVEALPGVARAGASYNLPLEGAFGIPFNIVGRANSDRRYDGRGWISVSPGYFEIFKIPLVRGRFFSVRDDANSEPAAIISQAMARQFWPKGDPLEDRIILGKGYGPEFEEPARQIVGIAGDVYDFGLSNKPGPLVYVPTAQVTDGITAIAGRVTTLAWIIRTRAAPHPLRSAIEKELQQTSGGLPVARVRSMDEIVVDSTSSANFNMSLLTIFACSALLLAAIGIYGVMSYNVRQRTREIGIRLAVGAESSQVRNMIVWQGMRLALSGIAIGILAALGLARLIASFLFGVRAWDPLTFISVPVILTAMALLATWLPAGRVAGIDTVEALRHE